jgi:hypothetical protein
MANSWGRDNERRVAEYVRIGLTSHHFGRRSGWRACAREWQFTSSLLSKYGPIRMQAEGKTDENPVLGLVEYYPDSFLLTLFVALVES